jgi:prepilin-type N-terminal cleavage/methylation domain-containing protein
MNIHPFSSQLPLVRRGMTLVEMLVAMVAALVLMAALAQAFSVMGASLSGNRALLELDGRLRTTAWRLRGDLAGCTANPIPPLNPAAGEGYLEIIEGPNSDMVACNWFDVASAVWVSGSFNKLTSATAWPGAVSDDRILGDEDDVLLLTTRGIEAPFIGRAPGAGANTFESTVAEVAWFARPTPNTSNPITYTLYRRQLLVMGYVGAPPFLAGDNTLAWSGSWSGYFESPCDVSVRREGGLLRPNTLADLTRREARFLHNPNGVVGAASFRERFAGGSHHTVIPPDGLVFAANGPRRGEDVVLTNVLAFDVRVYDPGVSAEDAGLAQRVPGDPGFTGMTSSGGAYVDLGHGFPLQNLLRYPIGPSVWPDTKMIAFNGRAAKFFDFGHPRSFLIGTGSTSRIYDTWSLSYEADGLDQDNVYGVDQGTNGLDDDNDGQFDESPYHNWTSLTDLTDPGEAETIPPYPFPLRGVEVRIRCYEPSSRQVRQVTVRHTFVPN